MDMVIVKTSDGRLVRYTAREAARLGLVDYRTPVTKPQRTKKAKPQTLEDASDDELRNDD